MSRPIWTYANGSGNRRTTIAADRSAAGVKIVVVDGVEQQVRSIIDDAARDPSSVGPVGPVPRGGSPYTPNQSSYDDAYRQTIGPSARVIMDHGNWDNSLAVTYPRLSGSPSSAHYRDLVSLWSHGAYFPLLYIRASIEKSTERILHLVPGR